MAGFINCTPHEINLISIFGTPIYTFPCSEFVARVAQTSVHIDDIDFPEIGDTVPLFSNQYGEVQGLPESKFGTFYIVSAMVLGRAKNRNDLVVPEGVKRDETGRIIGCTGFSIG